MKHWRFYAAVLLALAAVGTYPDGWIYTALQFAAATGFILVLGGHDGRS